MSTLATAATPSRRQGGSPTKRPCFRCKAFLSRYNGGPLCALCSRSWEIAFSREGRLTVARRKR